MCIMNSSKYEAGWSWWFKDGAFYRRFVWWLLWHVPWCGNTSHWLKKAQKVRLWNQFHECCTNVPVVSVALHKFSEMLFQIWTFSLLCCWHCVWNFFMDTQMGRQHLSVIVKEPSWFDQTRRTRKEIQNVMSHKSNVWNFFATPLKSNKRSTILFIISRAIKRYLRIPCTALLQKNENYCMGALCHGLIS